MSSPHSKASLIPAALGSRAGLAGMGAALGTRRRRARRKCARFCVTSHAEQLRALALVDGPADGQLIPAQTDGVPEPSQGVEV